MRILVVDDDLRIVKTTCDILKIKGHEPIAAYSGEEGIEKVTSEFPDCVLMDIKMTGLNGVEALKKMKAITPDLPVVLVSAYAANDLIEEARRSGAYAILSKPLDFPMILSFLSLLGTEDSILIVDDDPKFCRTLKDVLTVQGFSVETECKSQNVMNHLEENKKVDIVLLDLKLGSADGVDVLKDIQDRHPGKSVMLMTGYRHDMADSIEKARQIGVYTFLYKPFEMDELFRLIEEIRTARLLNALVSV